VASARAAGRLEQREAERAVLGYVAMLQGADLAPETAGEQLGLGAGAVETVGGARLVVVRRELVVRRRVAPAAARRDTLRVDHVDQPPDARRGSRGVDVEPPAVGRARVEERPRRGGPPPPPPPPPGAGRHAPPGGC